MSDAETVCWCELENGYIFKNYFAFSALRGRTTISFYHDCIVAANRTADNELYGRASLRGDEINLGWNPDISLDNRELSLTFDAAIVPETFNKIKKKDVARLTIARINNERYVIYFSCGTGGDGREGIRCIHTQRATADKTSIKYPRPEHWSMLTIPIKSFRQMIESFTKCKNGRIRISYYPSTDGESKSCLTIKSDNGILEKYGDVIDGAVLGDATLEDVNDSDGLNMFSISTDKIGIFAKLATMHNEGCVRIQYEQDRHLRIAYRFGSFGDAEICIY